VDHQAPDGIATLRWLRVVGLLEGVSFLVLLGIAMPLKYLADAPAMVRVVGMAHGVLFVGFLALLFWTGSQRGWRLGRALFGLLASLLPFGPFVFDRSLRAELEALSPATAARTAG
jgi:integral membrane protein